jgi:hypothetical protein
MMTAERTNAPVAFSWREPLGAEHQDTLIAFGRKSPEPFGWVEDDQLSTFDGHLRDAPRM